MRAIVLSSLAALSIVATARPAEALEVCVNGPSSYGGTIDTAAADAIIAMKPRCVRVPYRQDVWSAPDDPAALDAYDRLIDRYLAGGVEPYVLLHAESTNADPHVINDAQGRAAWVAGVTKVIDHFKPKVRRFELINEPNDWDASKSPTNPPDAFAATLADVYTSVKVNHPNDACWDVDLVSGALFAFHQQDGSGTSASDYLDQTYAAGIASHDWEGIRSKTGSYPLDGIGWHLYMEETDAAGTASRVASYLGEVWSVVAAREGAASAKKIWISEFGFPTDGSDAQDAAQADSLAFFYDALAGEPHVAMGTWFTFQDFDASGWGLYRMGGFDQAHAKPAKDRFDLEAASEIEGLWAKLAFEEAPTTMRAGETAQVVVTATNLGGDTWSAANAVRLGSGAGCPLSPEANAIAWVVSDGYAKSPTDARVYLGASDAVATGGAHRFAFEVRAPATPGTYAIAARMVREGVAWFGTPVWTKVTVTSGPAAGDAGASPDASVPDAGRTADDGGGAPPLGDAPPDSSSEGGCGCRAARSTSPRGGGGGVWSISTGLVALALSCCRAWRGRRARRSRRSRG